MRISFTVRSTRPMAATWMVDGFGLKAVNWVRQIVRHNGAAIDIWSQDDKKLTRLISSNGRHLIWATIYLADPKSPCLLRPLLPALAPPQKLDRLELGAVIDQLTERSFKNFIENRKEEADNRRIDDYPLPQVVNRIELPD